jgi:hypothetical protein
LTTNSQSIKRLNPLPHLIRPARGGAAAVVIVFAILLAIAANAGLFGIPLALILLSWFFKYAYILFDHVVRGFDEPPTLDIQMVNPLNEQRPLAQLAILGILYAGVKLASLTLPWAVAVFFAALAALLLPASIAILGLESNILKAIYPIALGRLVRDLGILYPAVLALIATYILVLGLLTKLNLWLPVQLAIDMFAILSMFSALAGAVYERRHELGLDTWHSPERTVERQLNAERHQSENIVTEVYGLVRAGSHVKAWQMLQTWLESRAHSTEDYRWLCDRVSSWQDSRYANRLTEEYVARLLILKRNGEALDAVTRRLRSDPGFRPKSAAATLQIAQLAAHGGGVPSVARALLSDFSQRFAGDPLMESANALARHLGE